MQKYAIIQTPNGVMIRVFNKTMFFDGITMKDMLVGNNKYDQGALIQDAFDFLSPDQREFLMTGMTPEDWEAMCKFAEEEDV